MSALDKRILTAMVRIGAPATAARVQEELVNPPDLAKVWAALDGLRAEGILDAKLRRHKMRYSLTVKGVKALAAINAGDVPDKLQQP